MAELLKNEPPVDSAFSCKRMEILIMFVFVIKYRPLPYPLCYNNNSGNWSIRSVFRRIPFKDFGRIS